MNVQVVAAHYNEETAWLAGLRYPHVVQTKAGLPKETPPNRGNENSTYLAWIVENYDNLPDYVVFIHAHRVSPHCARPMDEIINQLTFDCAYRNINDCAAFFLARFPEIIEQLRPHKHTLEQAFKCTFKLEKLRFKCCSQFYVSRAAILRHPREAYQTALEWLMTTPLTSALSGRLLEYTWHTIFTGEHDDMAEQRTIAFYHGLGDCSNFAPLLAACRSAGDDVAVSCDDTKRPLFEHLGIPTVSAGATTEPSAVVHHWWEPAKDVPPANNVFFNNKNYRNIADYPFVLPAPRDAFWANCTAAREQQTYSFAKFAPLVEKYLKDLPRPIVLLHSHGNTSAGEKNMPDHFAREFMMRFLRATAGSIVIADWDNRTPWMHSGRIRHIQYHAADRSFDLPALMGLIHSVDLVVGVDSGPLHLAGVVNAPSIGVWFGHHPVHYAVPSSKRLNISFADTLSNIYGARDFNTVQAPNNVHQPSYVARAAELMLTEPRRMYPLAADVQLRLLTEKCFGGYVEHPNVLHAGNVFYDRNIGFDYMFDRLARMSRPLEIVETGCIRADNDWAGAGYSTFLFGLFAARVGGCVTSFDITPEHVRYATDRCAVLGSVNIMRQDSISGIEAMQSPVDLLYLDSMDCYVPGYEEHGLREAQVGATKVAADGLIAFDDTLYEGSQCRGKGALGVPWLLQNGWRVCFAGHQVVLERA